MIQEIIEFFFCLTEKFLDLKNNENACFSFDLRLNYQNVISVLSDSAEFSVFSLIKWEINFEEWKIQERGILKCSGNWYLPQIRIFRKNLRICINELFNVRKSPVGRFF